MRNETIFEYVTSGDYRDPDAPSVAVTADLLENAVEYYVECMTEEERSLMLSEFLYEQMYHESQHNDEMGLVRDIVNDYIKDHD